MLAILIHSAVYYRVTAEIEAAIPAFMSASAARGWRIESNTPERRGWPWAPSVRLSHVVASRAVGNGILRWTGERVDLIVGLHDLGAVRIAPSGTQALDVSPYAPIRFSAGHALMRVPFADKSPATIDLRNLTVDGTNFTFEAGLVNAEITATAITLSASAIEVVPPLSPPFDAAARGSMRLATNVQPWRGTAAEWKTAGGRIELPALELRWGPLILLGSGTGQLDADLQPDAAVTLRINGAVETLATMARAGLIAPAPASAARAVLGLLTLAAHGGPVTLPVVFADQTVTVAQFPLLRLPSMPWNKP